MACSYMCVWNATRIFNYRDGIVDANRKAAKAAINVLQAIAIKEDEDLASKVLHICLHCIICTHFCIGVGHFSQYPTCMYCFRA